MARSNAMAILRTLLAVVLLLISAALLVTGCVSWIEEHANNSAGSNTDVVSTQRAEVKELGWAIAHGSECSLMVEIRA